MIESDDDVVVALDDLVGHAPQGALHVLGAS